MRAIVGWMVLLVLFAAAQAMAEDRKDDPAAPSPDQPTDSSGMNGRALETLRRPPATGLFVFEVISGSAAQIAGIQVGDILTHYDGQVVETHLDLSRLARMVNEEKRDEILLILHRRGEQIDRTIPPGPLGVRLEDVVAGEERILPTSSPPPPHLEHSWFTRILESGGQRWMLVYADSENGQPVGWTRYVFSRKPKDVGSLHIQQYLQQPKFVIQQDVLLNFSLDAYLSLRQMRWITNDKLVLDVHAQGEKWVGTRAGVLVESPLTPQTVSAYLAPYVAASLSENNARGLSCRYLPPGSLESAPLSEIGMSDVHPSDFVVRKLGREEMRGSIVEGNEVAAIHLRGGFRIEPASEEQVRAAFPNSMEETTAAEHPPSRLE